MATKRSRSKKKKTSLAVPAVIRRPIGLLVGPGRSFALGLLAIAVLVAACLAARQWLGDDLLASDQYQVTAANLEITPLPSWIGADPRGWVADYLRLKGPLSIMDDDAVDRVAGAFKLHPWVEHVVRVTKHHPATIHAELKYRRPVCLVLYDRKGELCPVDVHGVWLPGENFVCPEPTEYPIVVGVTSDPVSLAGMPWGDERVVGAAEIAAAFGRTWNELKMHRIIPVGYGHSGPRSEYTYDLYTRQGRRILWGRSPRSRAGDEPTAEEKISRLRQYAATHGGLDVASSLEPIDVRRSNTPRPVDPVAAAPQAARAGQPQ